MGTVGEGRFEEGVDVLDVFGHVEGEAALGGARGAQLGVEGHSPGYHGDVHGKAELLLELRVVVQHLRD